MATQNDFTKMFQNMMGAFPMEMPGFDEAFKSTAAMNEKFAKVALDAAGKSVEISTKWTKDTLAKIGDVSAVKADATDYTKAMTDFASAQAEIAAENLSAFAEVAKTLQMETVELVMAAGKDLGSEAQAAMKKATDEVAKAAKKATAAAK